MSKTKGFLLWIMALLLILLPDVVLYIFHIKMHNPSVEWVEKFGKIVTFVILIIYGPALETIITQTLIIHIIRAFVPKIRYSFLLSVTVSALIFGFMHPYGIAYIAGTMFTGIVLATVYYIFLYRKGSAFLIVFTLHAAVNLLPFLGYLFS
jgi:hypothetical protein